MSGLAMQLTLLLPTEVALDCPAEKIVAEAPNGFFCLLPRHVDFVTTLVPGILSYHNGAGEHFCAVHGGSLVKLGRQVRVTTAHAFLGDDLADLQAQVEAEFERLDEHERHTRAALAQLEAGTLRGFSHSRGGYR